MSENQLAIIAGGGSLSDIIIETAEKKRVEFNCICNWRLKYYKKSGYTPY